MPWVGVCDLQTGPGYAMIVETPEDAYIQVRTVEGKNGPVGAPVVGWAPRRAPLRIRGDSLSFRRPGRLCGPGQALPGVRQGAGADRSVRREAQENPNLARLFGAPDVWGDVNTAALKFAQEAKAAGVEKMLIHGGRPPRHEGHQRPGLPDQRIRQLHRRLPLEPGKEIDAHHDRIPGDVVLKADGERMKAWLTFDKKQYMKRCPALWTAAARVVSQGAGRTPFLGPLHRRHHGRGPLRVLRPEAPADRKDKRQCGVDLLRYIRGLGLVMGGEHGIWWAVPHLDYIEGMMSGGSYSWPAGHLMHPKTKDQEFTSPWGGNYGKWEDYEKWGIGHEYRVPLWELVFHDCIVSTWYWGDASDFLLDAAPEITPKKDAFNVLYGTIPLLWANKEGSWQNHREVFLRTYRNTCKLHEAIARPRCSATSSSRPTGPCSARGSPTAPR